MSKVVHIISDHAPFDVRVFFKQCTTLREQGHEVHLVARDAPVPARNGVVFHGVAATHGRGGLRARLLGRAFTLFRTYTRAKGLEADLYHLHEPLLIPVGLLLRARGRRVVYDAHEDYHQVALRIRRNRRVSGTLRVLAYALLESAAKRAFNGVVTATPAIARRFPGNRTCTIHNYPIVGSNFGPEAVPYAEREPVVAYMGGVSRVRGILEVVRGMALLPGELRARLVVAGSFTPASLEAEMRREAGWGRVEFMGWQQREGVAALLGGARLGVVTFHPGPNHDEALPNKLFEYMDAGLPVVASHFPLWRVIVEEAGCGLLVDPEDPRAIAAAVEWLLRNPAEAEAMGRRGQEAVRTRYSWAGEGERLIRFYEKVLD